MFFFDKFDQKLYKINFCKHPVQAVETQFFNVYIQDMAAKRKKIWEALVYRNSFLALQICSYFNKNSGSQNVDC